MPRRRQGYYPGSDEEEESDREIDRDLSIMQMSDPRRRKRSPRPNKKQQEEDRVQLRVAHVYGYRGTDSRNNVFVSKNGKVVYHCAAVGIVLDIEEEIQKHYTLHDDDITCLNIHPDGDLVATGQVGKHPTAHVWDMTTLKNVNILKKGQTHGISCVNFSEDGKKLLTIGADPSNTIIIWDWKRAAQLATAKGHSDRVFGGKFEPHDASRFVTFGVKHIKFWTHVPGGHTMNANRGTCGTKGPPDSHLCAEYGTEEKECFSGAGNGMIYCWHSNTLSKVIKCHEGPLLAMFPLQKGFLTAGKDGIVRQWNMLFTKKVAEFPIRRKDLVENSPSTLVHDFPNIRAVSLGAGRIVVGTKNGEIVEVNKEGGLRILAQGHGGGEVWGLSPHPTEAECATVSDDGYLRVWSTVPPYAPLAVRKLGKPARSVDYSHDASLIAVGFADGNVQVLNEEDFSIKFKFHHRKEKISDVKFQPRESIEQSPAILAVASHDNFIDFYDVKRGERIGAGSGASSYITHIDWTIDGQILQCNSGAAEHLFYDQRGKRLPIDPGDKEAEGPWYSWTSVLGPNVEGIRGKETDITDVNACCLDPSEQILATADDFGLVKVFDYPATGRHAEPLAEGRAHSSHVTNLRWMGDGQTIVSVGGADTALILWECKK